MHAVLFHCLALASAVRTAVPVSRCAAPALRRLVPPVNRLDAPIEEESAEAFVTSGSFSGVGAWMQQNVMQGVADGPATYTVMTVYFVQGILGLASLARTYFLKENLHLGPAESSALLGIASLPWVIKPVYGFLTDALPILGYRRKPYLILAGLLGAAGWASLATWVHTPGQAILASTIASLGVAMSDVVVDSLVVERARDDASASSGALQSLCWSCSSFGGLASAYLSGSLLETMTPQQVGWRLIASDCV